MRLRVAFNVTLATLAVLALLFFFNMSKLVDETNVDLREELESFCINTSVITADYGHEDRLEVVRKIRSNRRMITGLYDSAGAAEYVSDGSDAPLTEEEMRSAARGVVFQDRAKDASGHTVMFAIYQYEDGAFLMLKAEEATLLSTLQANPSLVLMWVSFVLCIACILIVLVTMRHRERYIDAVMKALDQFADGEFDAQITDFASSDPEVMQYNAVMTRIRDRIFKEKNRNHVLNTVMSQMQNGILAVDDSLRVIFVTSVAKKLLGIMGSAEGLHVNEASKDVRLDALFTEAMHQEGVYTNEVAARTVEGRGHRPLRLYVSRMQQEGHVAGALAIVEDITELRRLERVRTDFAANVSHELKTPLTSIQGFVETLDAGAIDNPEMAHKFLRIIMVETERLTRLINDILSISKLESGDDEVATERIRLDKKAHDVCEMLTIHASEKGVTINNRLNDVPVYIIGNPDRVEQLLINLTENAIKYNKPGGSVTVQVFADATEANVTISDTGIGIAEEHLPRLFERFYRVDKGRSRQMGGTGLGLAIVKHIVRSMNGEIEVQSKLGEGTEFLITLPLAPAENPDKETIFDDEE